MKRSELVKWTRLRVTREHILLQEDRLVRLIAAFGDGPLVQWDHQRGCWGLFADRDYPKGAKVTEYGGERSLEEISGPYVARLTSGIHIDGYSGFLLGPERGRWINEHDAVRSFVNVELARTIHTTRAVLKGEQFFGDYGDEYVRDYE